MTTRFDKLADYLAERYVAVQELKTASEKKTTWERLRPENPDRPGANWWTGLGGGALAAGVETGVGEHGLTDSVQRFFDRRNLRNNPLGQFNTAEFKNSIAGNEQAKFLHDLFNRQSVDTTGKNAIGQLLSRNYGTLNVGDPGEINRLHGELGNIVGTGDTEMSRRFSNLTTKGHGSNATRAKKIFDTIDRMLADNAVRAKPSMNPAATSQLTKLRTAFGNVESAEELDKLKKALQNLATSVQGGKKGTPATYLFGDKVRNMLTLLGKAPVETGRVQDADKVKDMVTALGQFTKGRNVPSFFRRLRRGGSAVGIGTVAGAYALPSAIDFGKWALGRGEQAGGK